MRVSRATRRAVALALLSLGAGLGLGAVPAAANPQGPLPSVPSLSPEFVAFRRQAAAGLLPLLTEDGHPLGYFPPPAAMVLAGRVPAANAKQAAALPASFDLRVLGRLPATRDQGASLTCWAFAAVNSLESCLLPGEARDLSEHHLKNTSGFDLDPDWGGGNIFMATAYLARWSGPVDEADDPYRAGAQRSPVGLPPRKRVLEVLYLPRRGGPADNAAIKQAVFEHGAVVASMFYERAYLNDATDAYYLAAGGPAYANHYVDIVGWDDHYSRANFLPVGGVLPAGNGAFLVRSSWGPGWGAGGYCYVSYHDAVLGTSGPSAVFPSAAEPPAGLDRIYQYDPLGNTMPRGYSGTQTDWIANVFTAADDEVLTAASWYTMEPDAEFGLYVFLNPVPPPRGTGLPAASRTGSLSMAGYHTVALDAPVELAAGTTFAVVVRLTTARSAVRIPLEEPVAGYSDGATAGAGQSYVGYDSWHWRDVTQIPEWSPRANVCIKAFTAVRDLAIDSVAPSVAAPGIGEPFDVDVVVRNLGSAAAGACAVEVFVDQPLDRDPSAAGDASLTLPGLAGGSSAKVTFTGLRCSRAGVRRLWAAVDREGRVRDVDQTNNSGPQGGLDLRVGGPPVVGDIPDQQVALGTPFAPVILDEYVDQLAGGNAELTWSVRPGLGMEASISPARVATVALAPGRQTGRGPVVFTATDAWGNADSDTAVFTVTATIDGHVSCCGSGAPVPGVEVRLAGEVTAAAFTDGAGAYRFPGVFGEGAVVPGRQEEDGGVNATDALRVMRHASGAEPLVQSCQRVAADVDRNGTVDAADAMMILRHAGGLGPLLCPEWAFLPVSVRFAQIARDPATADFVGVRMGDVNGSWQATAAGRSAGTAAAVEVGLGDAVADGGGLLLVPVQVGGPSWVAAATLELGYPAELVEVRGVQRWPGRTEPQIGAREGRLRLAWADLSGLPAPRAGHEAEFVLAFVATGRQGVGEVRLTGGMELADASGQPLPVRLGRTAVTVGQPPPAECLLRNWPNPFNARTAIDFRLPAAAQVRVAVYTVTGSLVAELADQPLSAGAHRLVWDGTDGAGRRLASGAYLCRLAVGGGRTRSIKMLLVR